MKVRLTFKTPDVCDFIDEELAERTKQISQKWIEYGECLTVEIDLEAETCIVVPLK